MDAFGQAGLEGFEGGDLLSHPDGRLFQFIMYDFKDKEKGLVRAVTVLSEIMSSDVQP